MAIALFVAMPQLISCAPSDNGEADRELRDSNEATAFGNVANQVFLDAPATMVLTPGQRIRDTVDNVTTVLGASDDRFLVVDTWGRNVKVYAADGSLNAVIGREGNGPGEFSNALQGAMVIGDDVYVPDIRLRRLSRFDINTGQFVESYKLPFDLIRGLPLTWVSAGTDGIFAVSVSLSTSTFGTGMQFTVSRFEHGSLYPIVEADANRSAAARNASNASLPVLAGGVDGQLFLGDRTLGNITLYNGVGTVLRNLEWAGDSPREMGAAELRYVQTVVAAERDARRRRMQERIGARVPKGMQMQFRRSLDSATGTAATSQSYPVFTDFRVDSRGRVWIGRPLTIAMMQDGPYELEWSDLNHVATCWERHHGVPRVDKLVGRNRIP